MKKALVIGVGPLNGLGAQLSKKIANNNFEVFVAGRTKDNLDLVVNDIIQDGNKAKSLVIDTTNEAHVKEMTKLVGSGLDFAVFDWAVNSGTGRSAKAVQKICGAAQDGAIGPKTLALVNGQNTQYMIEEFGKIRQNFYESLSTFDTFGRGWTRRNSETTKKALEMVENDD